MSPPLEPASATRIHTGLPCHVAIVMDGNGRWAQKRKLPRTIGHQKGVKVIREIVKASVEQDLQALTLFAFSSENWQRPPDEVNILMELFVSLLRRDVTELNNNNIRLRIIGEQSRFGPQLRKLIAKAEHTTRENTGLTLNIAANYGGRWDITQAVRAVAARVLAGELQCEKIEESDIESALCLTDMPAPDLLIRTGGELRISNFLLWQLAYTEFYFTETYWPEFSSKEFVSALNKFGGRQRRFGSIHSSNLSDQPASMTHVKS